jgi:hypothetical protein
VAGSIGSATASDPPMAATSSITITAFDLLNLFIEVHLMDR